MGTRGNRFAVQLLFFFFFLGGSQEPLRGSHGADFNKNIVDFTIDDTTGTTVKVEKEQFSLSRHDTGSYSIVADIIYCV